MAWAPSRGWQYFIRKLCSGYGNFSLRWMFFIHRQPLNMIVVFFPGFDRFTPVSTDSSPASTDFHPCKHSCYWTPPPLQSKCTLVNKVCIVLYFEIILFHFIWNKYILFTKKFNSENKYICWKNKIDTNPGLPPSHFNATGCRLWPTDSDRSQSSVVNSMQKEPSEIAVVQISRTEYITKCYRNMVDQIPQKRILRSWNQWVSHCLHRRPHIWNSRKSRSSRHHGAHARGNSRLNKS